MAGVSSEELSRGSKASDDGGDADSPSPLATLTGYTSPSSHTLVCNSAWLGRETHFLPRLSSDVGQAALQSCRILVWKQACITDP